MAVGVQQAVCGLIVGATGWAGHHGDPPLAEGFGDGLDPLFPFVWGLWFMVGVKQERAAGRAAATLLEQQRGGAATECGECSAAPFG